MKWNGAVRCDGWRRVKQTTIESNELLPCLVEFLRNSDDDDDDGGGERWATGVIARRECAAVRNFTL